MPAVMPATVADIDDIDNGDDREEEEAEEKEEDDTDADGGSEVSCAVGAAVFARDGGDSGWSGDAIGELVRESCHERR